MNRLDPRKQAQVVAALVEGNSIRATVRMTGVAKGTVQSLLVRLGSACSNYMNFTFKNLDCKRVQCDEIWSFIAAKQKNVPKMKAKPDYAGDVWTWVALDADTKLIVTWFVGGRHSVAAREFIKDLAWRLKNRIQLTTDGHKVYVNAVAEAFGESEIDYAMLVKLYGEDRQTEARYSPAVCIAARLEPIFGEPDLGHISTSYVERQNLTMRMQIRRFTRLTNAFSKKLENHVAAIALHYMHYNFCRIHQTLRITPAMAAGLTDHVWDVSDLLGIMESWPKEN